MGKVPKEAVGRTQECGGNTPSSIKPQGLRVTTAKGKDSPGKEEKMARAVVERARWDYI